jgi:hypothetical protein
MPNVYIEPRPKGRPEGDPIDDYVVEDHDDHVLATFKTQREAVEWAKKNGHTPLVARIRGLAVNFVLEIQAAMTRRAMQLRYYKLQSGC